ncbi:MAG: Rrf2 family transcriptional regulator [Nitrospirales bacterium]|nr:Rrf2 family transcriptional regulator [Nitrospirales bacterium]
MTKFPIKITYGIVALLELALNRENPPLQAKLIAQRQEIPARFIEQILQALKQAGIVSSLRGAQGGYSLSQDPTDISLADIVQAMNGPSASAVASTNGSSNGHGTPRKIQEMLLFDIWQKIQSAELAILSSVSLQTLVDQYQRLEHQGSLMYHI